ncbi:NAD(P)-dependent oxidoreductase [Anaeromicrobium sediminis]|uniref:Dehydrogenase n=1 Tax=Anaeromicrobium sediminis TaxID=1478221 RepID=A0A267MN79_9FIRM|nr:NAD(P)-dependent oxidoreductase [Anaeromicrobium sediminis]PAB61039.1 hypothetical protein CCE28_00995 [Anaeromicrobium sediminis]
MKNIGFVGLGDMGMGMAKNFLKAGYTVKGFDLREDRLNNFATAGGISTSNCAEVGKDSDVVFVMVLNGDQARNVVSGENGLMETMSPGSTLILTATIGLKPIKDIENILKEKGINMIDSGVSGGRGGANAGTLTMMASGSSEVFKNCQDILNVVGKDIYHVGEEIGMGQVVKSCLQALVGATFQATFETLVLGSKAGVKPETLVEVIGSSVVGTPLFNNAANLIMERKFKDTGSHIGTMYKDLGITMNLAKECGVPMFATGVAMEMFQAGISAFPEEDNWCIVKLLENMAGTIVKKVNR